MELEELAFYTVLALEARRMLIKELLNKEKKIRTNNRNVIKELSKEIQENPRILNRIDDHLRTKEKVIRDSLKREIDDGLTISVEAGIHQSKQATLSLLKKANIDWKPIERSLFRVSNQALEEMQTRRLRGLSLSDRIWSNSRNVRNSIGEIIQEAIREGLHPTEISHLLERYVIDGAKTFAVQYPNMFERISVPMDMNYESLRLARTEMAAAFGSATLESAKVNPSNKGVQWKISNAGVTCDVCLEHSKYNSGLGEGVYPVDELPDYPAHPNCLCVLVEVNEDTDDFVGKLIEWNENPLSQPDIEKWHQDVYKLGEVA